MNVDRTSIFSNGNSSVIEHRVWKKMGEGGSEYDDWIEGKYKTAWGSEVDDEVVMVMNEVLDEQ